MQVSVETTSKLGRRLVITVPAEEITNAYEKRIKELMQKVKMDGFRPGKAPRKVIESRFGAGARSEVLEDKLQTSLNTALTEKQLRPAGMPYIESIQAEPGQAMSYVASFEIFPEIELVSLADVTLEKKVVNITDADIDTVLEQMRKQRATWEDVTRAAKLGDKVTADIHWEKPSDKMRNQDNAQIILDQGKMPVEFEALVGKKVGDSVAIEMPLTSPDLPKTAKANITIKALAQPIMPVINDDFAKEFDVDGGLEALRKQVRQHMEDQLKDGLRAALTTQLADKLIEHYSTLELPKVLIDEEMTQQEQQYVKRLGKNAPQEVPAEIKDKMRAQAVRRLTLSAIYTAAMNLHKFEVDKARLQQKIERITSMFTGDARLMNMIYSDKNMMNNMRAQVLEDQIMDKFLEEVKLKEKAIPYNEFVKSNEAIAKESPELLHEHDHVHDEFCDHDH